MINRDTYDLIKTRFGVDLEGLKIKSTPREESNEFLELVREYGLMGGDDGKSAGSSEDEQTE